MPPLSLSLILVPVSTPCIGCSMCVSYKCTRGMSVKYLVYDIFSVVDHNFICIPTTVGIHLSSFNLLPSMCSFSKYKLTIHEYADLSDIFFKIHS